MDTQISGIRYLQKPLGYPKERKGDGGPRRISISTNNDNDLHLWAESPPLALIWQADSQRAGF